MALVVADRVLETTTTTGTGTVTLAGAATGYQSFAVIGNGNTTYYTIADQAGSNWEVGIGTYTSSGTTLSRDTVLASSNSNALVNFGAGTKNVFVTYPAGRSVTTTGVETLTNKTLGETVVDVNSANDALRITQAGTGNALVVEDSTNPDSTPTVIDTFGNVVLGKTARQAVTSNKVEVHSTSSTDGVRPNVGLYSWSATASVGSYLSFWHYPSGTVGTTTANSAGDVIGWISFYVFNGTSLTAKSISVSAASTTTLRAQYSFDENYFTNAVRVGTTSNYVGFSYSGAGTTIYSFPATDGTSGQVLSTNGSGTLSWTTATGLTQFVEAENTSAPNATVPVDSFTATDINYSNIDVAFVPKGTGAVAGQVSDGTTTGGNKRGASSTDWQRVRTAATQVASGQWASIGGGEDNTASGSDSAISGGYNNTASGAGSAVAGGYNNVASGENSFASGNGNTASGQYAFTLGVSNQATFASTFALGSSNQATVANAWAIGANNTSSGSAAGAIGANHTSDGSYSLALGGRYGSARGVAGYLSLPASVGPIAATAGTSQAGVLVLGVQTTTATPTVLRSNTSAAAATNQLALANNSAVVFRASVIANVTGGGDTKSWVIEGTIKRGANAASTALVGTPVVNIIAADSGASAWTVAATADTTNGALQITVTGAASTTIRWVARVDSTEVTF